MCACLCFRARCRLRHFKVYAIHLIADVPCPGPRQCRRDESFREASRKSAESLRLAPTQMNSNDGIQGTLKGRARLLTTLLLVLVWWSVGAQELSLPNAPNSVKFAVIGDAGTDDASQYEIANQMVQFHRTFTFDRVIMLGDNI
jgi:hypothetical protein